MLSSQGKRHFQKSAQWCNCLELRVNSLRFPMNQLCAANDLCPSTNLQTLYKWSGAKKGMICCQWHFVQHKCFPAAPVVAKSCSALGSTKQKFLPNLPFFGSVSIPASLQQGVSSEQGWVCTSQSLLLLSRRHQTLEKQQGEMRAGCPCCFTRRSQGEKHDLGYRDKRPDGIQKLEEIEREI